MRNIKYPFIILFTILGVVFSIVVAVLVAVQVFMDNTANQRYQQDGLWVGVFAGLLVVAGLLFWQKHGQVMLRVLFLIALFLLFIPAIAGQAYVSLLVLFWILLLSAAAGSWILQKFFAQELPWMERICLGSLIGVGFLQVILFLMGVLRLYYATVAYGLLAVLSILLLPSFVRREGPHLKNLWRRLNRRTPKADLRALALALSLLGICALGTYIWALAPSTRWDALSYHLGAPDIYLRAHSMVEIPESFNTYWAHYADMSYVLALLTAGQPLPGLLHFSMGLLSTGLVFLCGRRIAGIKAGLVAAVLFYSVPLIGFESGTAYIDLFITAYYAGLVYACLSWWQENNQRWLLLAGFLAGMAAGCKVTAIPLILPIGIVILAGLLKRHQLHPATWKGSLKFVGPAVLFLAPWLVRDALWTGNPVYPLFNSIFGSALWVQSKDLFGISAVSGNSLLDFLTLPWRMVTESKLYYLESPGAVLAGLPLLALPWGYLWKNKKNPGWRTPALAGVFILVSGTFLLFLMAKHLRYLMPVLTISSVLAALNLELIWQSIRGWKHSAWGLAAGVLFALTYIFGSRLGLIARISELPERFPVQVVLGLEGKEAFLERAIPVYDALQYLRQLDDGAPKVLSLGNEFRFYTTARIYGIQFSTEARQIVNEALGSADLAQRLADKGYTYLLINYPERDYNPKSYDPPAVNQEFISRYTQLVYYKNRIAIYRLLDPAHPNPPAVNLLQNSGFEAVNPNGTAENWQIQGQPEIITSPEAVHSGNHSLLIIGPDSTQAYSYIYQDIQNIKPGSIYTVGYWMYPINDSQLQLQVKWMDASNNEISTDQSWKALQSGWQWYSMYVEAPTGAVAGRVYASITRDGMAYADDICFVEGQSCP